MDGRKDEWTFWQLMCPELQSAVENMKTKINLLEIIISVPITRSPIDSSTSNLLSHDQHFLSAGHWTSYSS